MMFFRNMRSNLRLLWLDFKISNLEFGNQRTDWGTTSDVDSTGRTLGADGPGS